MIKFIECDFLYYRIVLKLIEVICMGYDVSVYFVFFGIRIIYGIISYYIYVIDDVGCNIYLK